MSLNECLFLATIIPKPKGFMYRFDTNHQLQSFAKQEQTFLTKRMLRRKILIENDTINNLPLFINGSAKLFLKEKSTSIEIDSTNVEEFEF